MNAVIRAQRSTWLLVLIGILLGSGSVRGAEPAKIYVVLWFDTEDYILPASDDAALRVAELLTKQKIRATFKIVGEKARTLVQRGRTDVIAALKKHEIGYHSNYHSTQPSPAMYLSTLGWDEGVAEFDRREGPGRADVQRIFGQAPTCYGQPGSSWGPQAFGAMRQWGVPVYLDDGSHVHLADKPHYYCGVLTLYKLAHTLRANLLNPNELGAAQDRFAQAKQRLMAEGGGIVSIYYHPCEFVHKEFWDSVNFRNGANPARAEWKLPAAKTKQESDTAYRIFEDYVRFIERFPEVRFITASDAAKLYRDKARTHTFTATEMKTIARTVKEGVTFQTHGDHALSASEVFWLLNGYFLRLIAGEGGVDTPFAGTPYGPTNPVSPLAEPVETSWSQFVRSAQDVAEYLRKHQHIPPTVWLGSRPVPPEAYLVALARLMVDRMDGKLLPETIQVKPATLTAADHVAADDPNLWGWVIFPRGFRAPAMMELAKRQAWTLKPALLHESVE
jgi:hypothetical protein